MALQVSRMHGARTDITQTHNSYFGIHKFSEFDQDNGAALGALDSGEPKKSCFPLLDLIST